MAVMDKEGSGPQFGAEGLTIALRGPGEEARRAKSRLGSYYAKGPDGRRSLFSDADGPKSANLVNLKVGCNSLIAFCAQNLAILLCCTAKCVLLYSGGVAWSPSQNFLTSEGLND